jgi:hypothetical protein
MLYMSSQSSDNNMTLSITFKLGNLDTAQISANRVAIAIP